MNAHGQSLAVQRGFTLVELMIALVIGLIIMLGASQLFVTSRQSFDRIEGLAERQETLRFLVDSISLNVRTADKGNMVISDGGSTLTLAYTGTREDDPYCSAGEALKGVSYNFKESDSTLFINPKCGEEFKGSEPLVSGLEQVGFESEESLSDRIYIGVKLRFFPIGDEPAASREVAFMATNRAMVIAKINE